MPTQSFGPRAAYGPKTKTARNAAGTASNTTKPHRKLVATTSSTMGLTHRRARSTRQRRRRKPEQEPPDPQFSCSSVWPKFEARSLKGHLPRSVARPPERYTCATFCVPMLVSASFCYNLRQFAAWSSQHPSVMVRCRRPTANRRAGAFIRYGRRSTSHGDGEERGRRHLRVHRAHANRRHPRPPHHRRPTASDHRRRALPCAHWTERPRAMRSVTTAHTLIAVTCATPRHPHGRGCSRKVAALGLDVKRPTRSGRRRSTMHAVVRSGNAP